MTIAVCIKCGSIKHGALTPCNKCNFHPESNEDKAKAMVLTDHSLSKEDLEGISKRIQNNLEVVYPDEIVQDYIKTFEENPNLAIPKSLKLGCLIIIGIFIAIIFLYINP